jgi:hypothetical protein
MAALSAISCGSDSSVSTVETGAIEVTSSTTGGLLDPDGYTVSLDATSGQPIGINASLTLTDVAPGQHMVELSGLTSNCTVTGSNPTAVTVVANATAQSSFTVTCVSGSIEIITATSGTDLDPDGYAVSLDGAPEQPIGISASLTLTDVTPGQHTVELSGLASNCTVTGSNPRAVTVVAGATGQVSLDVICSSPGNIQVTVSTTGANIPGLFIVFIQPPSLYFLEISPNGSVTSQPLSVGGHTVTLGVSPNCSVTGSTTQTVTVQAGVTTQVNFTAVCS